MMAGESGCVSVWVRCEVLAGRIQLVSVCFSVDCVGLSVMADERGCVSVWVSVKF